MRISVIIPATSGSALAAMLGNPAMTEKARTRHQRISGRPLAPMAGTSQEPSILGQAPDRAGPQGACHGRMHRADEGFGDDVIRGSGVLPASGLASCPNKRPEGQRRRVGPADQRAGAGGGGGGGGPGGGSGGTRPGAVPGAAAGGSPQRNTSA